MHWNVQTLHFTPGYIINFSSKNKVHTGRSQCANQTKEGTKKRQSPIIHPHAFFPPLLSRPLFPPATFICCSINNCYCSFNYAPVISKSGGHVSSPSQGSLGNYRHPSKGQCSRSVAVAIITPLVLTSVQWTRSPSGLSLSRHAFLCQAWPLTPPLALWGVFVYSETRGHHPPRYNRFFNLNTDSLPINLMDMWALGEISNIWVFDFDYCTRPLFTHP